MGFPKQLCVLPWLFNVYLHIRCGSRLWNNFNIIDPLCSTFAVTIVSVWCADAVQFQNDKSELKVMNFWLVHEASFNVSYMTQHKAHLIGDNKNENKSFNIRSLI